MQFLCHRLAGQNQVSLKGFTRVTRPLLNIMLKYDFFGVKGDVYPVIHLRIHISRIRRFHIR